jgi:hypothetical protein
MINVRCNVFETNSSSSHSITIADRYYHKDNIPEELFETIEQDEYGEITLTGGEFGWSYDQYSDALTKANYAAIDSYHCPIMQQMLIEVIMEHTGCAKVVIDINFDWSVSANAVSYIDHQSQNLTHDYFSSKELLKSFIFDSNYILTIDNDNH